MHRLQSTEADFGATPAKAGPGAAGGAEGADAALAPAATSGTKMVWHPRQVTRYPGCESFVDGTELFLPHFGQLISIFQRLFNEPIGAIIYQNGCRMGSVRRSDYGLPVGSLVSYSRTLVLSDRIFLCDRQMLL
jgi:hypothetical protein